MKTGLSGLAADRVRRTGRLGPLEATVVEEPATAAAWLKVVVDTQPGRVRECPWMPRDGAMPAVGDGALVVESDAGNLWVIAWWPAQPVGS